MAKYIGWFDLTKEEQALAKELGITGTKYQGSYAVRSNGEDNPDWTSIRPLLQDANKRTEFLKEFAGVTGGDLTNAWATWQQEEPIRQQERVATATLDLSMQNIPEIIAGGTAKATKGKRQIQRPNGSPVVTALGLGTPQGGANWANNLGIM